MHKTIERPPTVSYYVLDAIRGQILEGRYQPGEKLDQKQLADDLGVSLIPIRESLQKLEAEGFVRISPHRGAFIADLSTDELEEIYMIRENLEKLITQLAVPNLTPDTLQQLEKMIGEMEQAILTRDENKLLDLNRSFHFSIYDAANRPVLFQIITSLWDRSIRYRRLYTHLPGRASQALAEHKEIYNACKNRDAGAAARAVQHNVRQTADGLLKRVHNSGSLA